MATALRRCLLAMLCAALVVRAAGMAHYVAKRTTTDRPLGHYEGTMAHWVRAAREGQPLYPDGRTPPHDANAYGPLYFWLCGWAARSLDAAPEGMLVLARLAALAAYLATTALLAEAVRRRHGALAGAIAGGVAAAPQFFQPFALMVRSDTLAELLGFAGFLLAGRRGWVSGSGAAALLATALLTRQTAGMFALAAAAACLWEGRRGRAAAVFAGALAGFAGAWALVVAAEPHAAESLLLQRHVPFEAGAFRAAASRLATRCPELVFGTVAALCMGSASGERRWSALAAVALAAGLATAAKAGSDLNYFLSWRLPAGWALAVLAAPGARGWGRSSALDAATVLCGWSAALSVLAAQARDELDLDPLRARQGMEFRQLAGAATKVRAFTDDSWLAYRARIPLTDPGLIVALARAGQVDPETLAGPLRRREYALVALGSDPFTDWYQERLEALPPAAVDALRAEYRLDGVIGGLFVFVPK